MEKATTIRFDELSHDVARLQSNSETQKKVLAQELARIEEQTESAVQRTQTQIDSLRQQTADMHWSLTARDCHGFDNPRGFQARVRQGTGTGCHI